MRLTTKQHSKYWTDRKINWNEHYTATWQHPHRDFICKILSELRWVSIVEIGCASGPNLIKIANTFPKVDVGGIDINPEAIETARNIFKEGKRRAFFKVGDGENVMMSDNSTDVVLTDMTLIYVGPRKIKKYLAEAQRITRNYIVLHELYSKNWWERLWLRLKSGYHSYNYGQILHDLGFYDIKITKVPIECFPNADPIQRKFNYIITAKK